MGKVRLSIFYRGLLRPPLITFSFTVHGQRLVHAGAARAPLISGCGQTSGMKRGEKSKSPIALATPLVSLTVAPRRQRKRHVILFPPLRNA